MRRRQDGARQRAYHRRQYPTGAAHRCLLGIRMRRWVVHQLLSERGQRAVGMPHANKCDPGLNMHRIRYPDGNADADNHPNTHGDPHMPQHPRRPRAPLAGCRLCRSALFHQLQLRPVTETPTHTPTPSATDGLLLPRRGRRAATCSASDPQPALMVVDAPPVRPCAGHLAEQLGVQNFRDRSCWWFHTSSRTGEFGSRCDLRHSRHQEPRRGPQSQTHLPRRSTARNSTRREASVEVRRGFRTQSAPTGQPFARGFTSVHRKAWQIRRPDGIHSPGGA
jgi:hypothetical protein